MALRRYRFTDQPLTQAARRGQFIGPSAASLLPRTTRAGKGVQFPGRQPTLNPAVLRQTGDQVLDPGQLEFGFRELEGVGAPTVQSFLDLVLTGEQSRAIQGVAKTAAARGIRGGAVESQLGRGIEQFLAFNRAKGFRNVTQEAGEAFNRLQAGSGKFLEQAGFLETLQGAGFRGPGEVVSQGTGNLRQFAQPLFQALISQGRQRALVGGLLMGQGVDLNTLGLTGQDRQIAAAVNQFLTPQLTPEQRARVSERQQLLSNLARRAGGAPNPYSFRNVALTELGSTRTGAGQYLAEAIQQPLQKFQQQVAFLRGSQIPISAFLAARLAGGARRITELDVSQFQQSLGTVQGRAPRATVGNFGLTPAFLR